MGSEREEEFSCTERHQSMLQTGVHDITHTYTHTHIHTYTYTYTHMSTGQIE